MPWQKIDDYGSDGWSVGDFLWRARHYCSELEKGQILFFPLPPFALPQDDIDFLVSLKPADSRLHKNISYRPEQDLLRGFADTANEPRVHDIMQRRPLEEEGRDLPLHKRNDLLHVDAFPSRPTRGGRILRIFTNVNPARDRVWIVGDRFPQLAARFAELAGLRKFAHASGALRGWKRGLGTLGLPVADRAPYDRFMLHFHDWLKKNTAFQISKQGKEQLEFPPASTWLVFTDCVPHAALAGQFAMEQTFIIPVEALVVPEISPIRVLEKMAGKPMN